MRKRVFLALLLIGGLLSLVWLVSSQSTASKSLTKAEPSTVLSTPSKEAVSAKLANLERGWVKNEGQWDERALFSAPGYFGTTWITKDGELLHVAVKKEECKDKIEKAHTCPSKSWVISERWVGGKVQTIKGEEELQTKVSYFIGNDPSKHRSGLSTYRYVSLGEVWSGIEVKLKATQKTVEKLFYIKPGADPSKIVVQVDGAKGLKLSKDGEIIIKTGLGDLKLSKPIAWQEKDGKKLPVEVSYKLIGKNRYSFVVAKADPSLPIVIDPILQATYLGGSGYDYAFALAIGPAPNYYVYVAGETSSTDFPNTSGGAQETNNGYSDAFVAKLNSSLNLLQSTYLGGSGDDYAYALAISSTGDVYVAGYTTSLNFPRTSGGAQQTSGGGSDAFVARLRPDLQTGAILQSTYLGGSSSEAAFAIAVSSTGDVYVAGRTSSPNFPNTSGGAQASSGGGDDAFVVKLDSTLTNSSFQSTYLGGSGGDFARALAISSTGEVYVMGETNSNDFPGTSGRASSRTDQDAFVAKLSADLGASASSYTLSINPMPTNGNVTSSPAGINCGSGGSTCSASFTSGSTVALTATPSTGYTFAGWTGDCSGCGNSTTCNIIMTANKTCSANFTASGDGGGGGGGSGDGSGSGGGGSGSGSGSGSSGGGSGGGGGCSMTGSASSVAGLWNILVWLSVPLFALVRRIRKK
jgi:uncharacterized repeat protein (TIGR02543 family)